MRFGSDLNAFTSFDETIYVLQIPMDSAAILDNAFLILEDWAHNVTFDPKAIDKERGIIVEEWRLGQGAAARMRDKQIPILLAGSRYAERLPDGKKEVIETFAHDTLKRFYRTWYRPNLMAVVAVGDFDKARIEGLRQEALRAPDQPARRPGPSELSGAGPRRDVLRHHPGQGGVPERRGRLSQAPRGRPEHGRILPPDARRAALQRHVQRPAHRDRPEARSAVPRRRLEPGAVRRLQGRLRPLGPRRRRRHPQGAPGPLHGRGAGGPLRLHGDRARAPQGDRHALLRAGPGREGDRGLQQLRRGVHPGLPRGRADARHPVRVRPAQALPARRQPRRGQRPVPRVDDRPEPGRHGQPAGEARRRRADRGRAPEGPGGRPDRDGHRRLRGHDDGRAAAGRGAGAGRDRRAARDPRGSASPSGRSRTAPASSSSRRISRRTRSSSRPRARAASRSPRT